jgi:hypothetical protein
MIYWRGKKPDPQWWARFLVELFWQVVSRWF